MLVTQESGFTGLQIGAIESLEDKLLNKNHQQQRQVLYVQEDDTHTLVETGTIIFEESKVADMHDAPIHIKDISEMSYSDFMLCNYGQPYQRYYNPPSTNKLKII